MKRTDTNTKNRILVTAGRLFSQRGFFGVSMHDIADELSISKAALYYHFESKDALTQELLRDTVDQLKIELNKAINKGTLPTDKIFNLIKALLDFKIKHPELSLLVSLGFTPDERMPIVQFIVDLRAELIKFIRDLIEGVNIVQRTTYESIFTVASSVIGLVLSPFLEITRTSEDVAEDFIRLLFPQKSHS